MQGKIALAAVLAMLVCAPPALIAGPMENALAKLSPEERAHQACILRGLETVRRDARLRKADRMKTSILSPAVLDGTLLTAKGGAVRAGSNWYAMSFSCQLTGDLMKATSFSYVLGAEIAKNTWERYGLWQ
jgi:hypothetical protein